MYRSNGKLYKAQGIILSRKNIGEADRVVTVFTKEYGKLRLIAKGIRRVTSRRAPYLEVFTQCTLMVHKGSSMDSITEAQPIEAFERVRLDLARVSIAYLYCELISVLLAEKQEHVDIYDLLVQALTELNTHDAATRQAESREFTLELLWRLGFLPRSKRLTGAKLQDFVESIAERHLRTPKMVRQLL